LQNRWNADPIEGPRWLDFANCHSYDPSPQFATVFKLIDHRASGKGLTLGEFGARFLHNARVNGGDGEAGDADRKLFETTVGLAFGLGGASADNWCFRGLPDVIFPWELYRSDRVPRPSHAEFAALTLASRAVEPVYEAPELYLLLPDETREGPRYGEIDAALARGVSELLSLHAPFAVLHEHDLAIPPNAKAILWPLCYCPSDDTFERVRVWVAAGGRLYLSGDPGFDQRRQYTKGARLAALGLPAGDGQGLRPAAPVAAAVERAVGQGRVTYVAGPAELHGERLPALYRAWLASAGVAPAPVAPEAADLQVGRVATRAGGRVWVAANWGAPRDVTFEGRAALHVGTEHLGWLHLGPAGEVLGVMAQGDVTADGPVLAAKAPVMALSRDGRDLRQASRLVLVPLAAGAVTLTTRNAWRAPLAVAGEVRDGAWHELGRLPVKADGGNLTVVLSEDLRDTLVIVAEPEALAATAAGLVKDVLIAPTPRA